MNRTALLLLLMAVGAAGQGRQSIAANVNGEVITTAEVYRKLAPEFRGIDHNEQLTAAEKRKAKAKRWKAALRDMVINRLTVQAAEKLGIEVSEKKVKEEVAKQAREHGGLGPFVKLLDENGMTLDDISSVFRTRLIKRDLLIRKFGMGKKHRPQVDTFVSPRELRRYYQRNLNLYRRRTRFKLQRIVIPFAGALARQKALKLARSLVERARKGEDFSALARKHSKGPQAAAGGAWPVEGTEGKKKWVDTVIDDLGLEFRKSVAALGRGRVSEPIPTATRLFVFKVVDRTEGGVEEFEKVQERIRAQLRGAKIKRSIDAIMGRLVREAYIWPENLFEDR